MAWATQAQKSYSEKLVVFTWKGYPRWPGIVLPAKKDKSKAQTVTLLRWQTTHWQGSPGSKPLPSVRAHSSLDIYDVLVTRAMLGKNCGRNRIAPGPFISSTMAVLKRL